MARPLPSSPRPYYPEPIDEDGLEALVAIIRPRLIDPDSEPRVRDLFRDQLEDAAGRLKNEVRALSPAQDVEKLWEIYEEIQSTTLHAAASGDVDVEKIRRKIKKKDDPQEP